MDTGGAGVFTGEVDELGAVWFDGLLGCWPTTFTVSAKEPPAGGAMLSMLKPQVADFPGSSVVPTTVGHLSFRSMADWPGHWSVSDLIWTGTVPGLLTTARNGTVCPA